MIIIGRLVEKLSPEKDSVMQWNKKAGNINTTINNRVDFTLPALSETNVATQKCHMDDSNKGMYDMLLGQ